MFYVFPKAIAPNICDEIVKDCKKNALKKATVFNTDNKTYRDDPDIRRTSIHFITDKDHKINELIWSFLREANRIEFHYDLTHVLPIQFCEYSKGDYYDWHQDDTGVMKSNQPRKLSLTLSLTNPDTFDGGELQFYNGSKPMMNLGKITSEQIKEDIKSQGSVVVFDSRDFHRVTEVSSGVRHSVVCWCVGPNFK